jgi:hypothetical protein
VYVSECCTLVGLREREREKRREEKREKKSVARLARRASNRRRRPGLPSSSFEWWWETLKLALCTESEHHDLLCATMRPRCSGEREKKKEGWIFLWEAGGVAGRGAGSGVGGGGGGGQGRHPSSGAPPTDTRGRGRGERRCYMHRLAGPGGRRGARNECVFFSAGGGRRLFHPPSPRPSSFLSSSSLFFSIKTKRPTKNSHIPHIEKHKYDHASRIITRTDPAAP